MGIAAPLSDHVFIARAMGQKGFFSTVLESLLSGDSVEKILTVAEKDLDSLFTLDEDADGDVDAHGGGKKEDHWPIAAQPIWRTHRRATALSLFAAVTAVGV